MSATNSTPTIKVKLYSENTGGGSTSAQVPIDGKTHDITQLFQPNHPSDHPGKVIADTLLIASQDLAGVDVALFTPSGHLCLQVRKEDKGQRFAGDDQDLGGYTIRAKKSG